MLQVNRWIYELENEFRDQLRIQDVTQTVAGTLSLSSVFTPHFQFVGAHRS